MFHFRSEEMFIPRSLADFTISNGWLFTTIESSVGSDFENVIRSSLHLVSFNWNFVARVDLDVRKLVWTKSVYAFSIN